MIEGFRVALPGKDANTASPKEVITDTTLISLPIHAEGAFTGVTTGGVGSAANTIQVVIPHDLGYAPLTRVWCSGIAFNGTDYVEDPTKKLAMPVVQTGFVFQSYGFKDRIILRIEPVGWGITSAAFTLHGYYYIFEYLPTGLKV